MTAQEKELFFSRYPDHPFVDLGEPPPCSSSISGVPEEKTAELPFTGGKTIWGKVTLVAFDIYPTPLCQPPAKLKKDEESDMQGGHVRGAAYALCSEKDGKTVLICVSQVTDNPALAEEIFKTFRWTK